MGSKNCQHCGQRRARLCEECSKGGARVDVPWTPFEKVEVNSVDPVVQWAHAGYEVYLNSRYQVAVRRLDGTLGPALVLSIKRRDRLPIHDWRDLERVKSEIAGPESEGVEIYPAESRVVDSSNQFWMTVFTKFKFPFGFHDQRLVTEAGYEDAVQRPFEKDSRPPDMMTAEQIQAAIEKRRRRVAQDPSQA